MGNIKFALLVLMLLSISGAAGISGVAAQRYHAGGRLSLVDTGVYPGSIQELAPPAPIWQQVNGDGFGDPDTDEVSALAVFNGYLYAGVSNTNLLEGAQIFRSQNGVSWTPVTEPGFALPHDNRPPAILDLTVFQGRLYASTGRGNAAQIWRSLDGEIWAPMVNSGFWNPDSVGIAALTEYDGKIYAGVWNDVSGAQIWSSYTGDNNSWTQVAPAVPGTGPGGVSGMAVFDGALYAAIDSEGPAQIWRSFGGPWSAVVSDGFGSDLTTITGGMAVFGGFLYVGAGNEKSGAQLWRTNDGENWTQVNNPGFGAPNNRAVEMVSVWQNQLYVSVKNTLTGIEVWRSPDGAAWEQANQDGFGDSSNSGSNSSLATAEFLGDLYIGTSNAVTGGELWRFYQPRQYFYLPFIWR